MLEMLNEIFMEALTGKKFPFRVILRPPLIIKDVLMGILKSNLLGLATAVVHAAGQQFLAVCRGLNLNF